MRSEITEVVPATALRTSDTLTGLPLHAWEALPIPIRVQDRLVDILILVDELQAEFDRVAATPIRWAEGEVDQIAEQIERLLEFLSN